LSIVGFVVSVAAAAVAAAVVADAERKFNAKVGACLFNP